MTTPFGDLVATSQWREEAKGWVRTVLDRHGIEVAGVVGPTRVRPWSAGLVVPTDAGTAYFKAGCPTVAHEAAVHALLADLEPQEVDEPLGADPDRGWLLTRGRGRTLRKSRRASTADWSRLLRLTGRLQRRLAGHGPPLLAAGLPDRSPSTVAGRFERLVVELTALPAGHPSRVGPGEARELLARRGQVEAAAAALVDDGLPATFQHGDLHPGNVVAVDDDLRVFDFGDAMWAHPHEVLAVPFGLVAAHDRLDWTAILAAYCDGWGEGLNPARADALEGSVRVTHDVNRARTWLGAVASITGAAREEWVGSPRWYLRRAVGLDTEGVIS